MEDNKKPWHGYVVTGDVAEIDLIANANGHINLDMEDIVNALSEDGDNFVSSGFGNTVDAALKAAIDALPMHIGQVNNILIQLLIGDRDASMTDMKGISDMIGALQEDIDLAWGYAKDSALGDKCKAIVIASRGR